MKKNSKFYPDIEMKKPQQKSWWVLKNLIIEISSILTDSIFNKIP